jgi:hypothetical protein
MQITHEVGGGAITSVISIRIVSLKQLEKATISKYIKIQVYSQQHPNITKYVAKLELGSWPNLYNIFIRNVAMDHINISADINTNCIPYIFINKNYPNLSKKKIHWRISI